MTPVLAPCRGGPHLLTDGQMLAFLRTHVRADDDGCLIWAGSVGSGSTPIVTWNYRQHSVRRLMATLLGREITANRVAYSACGKTSCVSEACLRFGTRKQMFQAMKKAGATHRGVGHSLKIAATRAPHAKLPMSERFNVRRMRAEGWTWRRIAMHYGLHDSAPHHAMACWERLFGPAQFWIEPIHGRTAA